MLRNENFTTYGKMKENKFNSEVWCKQYRERPDKVPYV